MINGLMANNVAENFMRKGVDFVQKIYFLFMWEQYCVINTKLLVKYIIFTRNFVRIRFSCMYVQYVEDTCNRPIFAEISPPLVVWSPCPHFLWGLIPPPPPTYRYPLSSLAKGGLTHSQSSFLSFWHTHVLKLFIFCASVGVYRSCMLVSYPS
jgi:hypothetical protein